MRALEKANLGCALEWILHLCAYFINTYQFCVLSVWLFNVKNNSS